MKREERPEAPQQQCCERCGGPYQWTNGKMVLCWKCYEAIVHEASPASPVEVAIVKRKREVEQWIEKHPEFKTRRDACLHALKARGLVNLLPSGLRE